MIAFNFQHSLYIHSFLNCIKSVRKFYPNNLIDFYIDDTCENYNEYKKICGDYNVTINFRNQIQGYIRREDSIEINIPKILESQYRVYSTCKKTDENWIMLLEDDVVIKREIKHWPDSDCGTNREYFKNGGGSIIKTNTFIKAYETFGEVGMEKLIITNNEYAWAGDALKSEMFMAIGATYEKWIELAEPGYYDHTDHAVFHGYKELHKLI